MGGRVGRSDSVIIDAFAFKRQVELEKYDCENY